MSRTPNLTNDDINAISMAITDTVENRTSGNVDAMYDVYQHAFAIFLLSTCKDKDHLMEGVDEFKHRCAHYYDEHQKISNTNNP